MSGIGLQSHLGPEPIDLAKAEDTFNRLHTQFGLPMWITEFDWRNQEWGHCNEITDDHAQHAIELDNYLRLCLRCPYPTFTLCQNQILFE